jgi:small neutral amino acid transporter SnatA (MarC family)
MLILACKGARWLNPIILKLSYRISGLFLVAMAIQSIMIGMEESGLLHCKKLYPSAIERASN